MAISSTQHSRGTRREEDKSVGCRAQAGSICSKAQGRREAGEVAFRSKAQGRRESGEVAFRLRGRALESRGRNHFTQGNGCDGPGYEGGGGATPRGAEACAARHLIQHGNSQHLQGVGTSCSSTCYSRSTRSSCSARGRHQYSADVTHCEPEGHTVGNSEGDAGKHSEVLAECNSESNTGCDPQGDSECYSYGNPDDEPEIISVGRRWFAFGRGNAE